MIIFTSRIPQQLTAKMIVLYKKLFKLIFFILNIKKSKEKNYA